MKNKENKYTWILFDADGTLFDYNQAELTALKKTLETHKINFTKEFHQNYKEVNLASWKAVEESRLEAKKVNLARFRSLFYKLKIQIDTELFAENYITEMSRCAMLIDGALNTIKELSSRYQLALISNGLTKVQRPRFKASPISQYFESITLSEEEKAAKPSPIIFDAAFAKMGHPPKDKVLLVGDSLSADIIGGNNYGIDTCWFTNGSKTKNTDKANYRIQKLEELLSII